MNSKPIQNWISSNNPNGAAKLAIASNISIPLVYKIVSSNHVPSLEIIKRISGAIGVNIMDLIAEDNDDKPPAA